MQRRILCGALLAACAIAALPAHAESKFPDRSVTLIVPFAPGGNLDIVARTIAPALSTALGQAVVVDNRAGAGGALGASFVARAKPDGYTLLVSTPNALVVSPLITKTTYQLTSFKPIGSVSTTPLAIVVRAKSRFADIKSLLAEIHAQPGKLSVGHSGNGTTNHVAILQFEKAAQASLNVVPYKGSGPALTDLVGGQIDLVVDQLTSSAPLIKSGELRALAIMAKDREPTLPDVPTLREAGLKDFDASTATGLLAPADTPAEIIATLNAALRKALDDAAVKRSLATVGSPAHPSSADEWAATLQREQATAQGLAKAGLLKAE